jgi:putative NADPH-quinone reductase
MPKRILIIDGHPDPASERFIHALSAAYAEGCATAGHEVRNVQLATLDFPLLRSADEWHNGALPPNLREALEGIAWAEHLVFFFPLWLGGMPALLKGFLEQVARPGFAMGTQDKTHPMGMKLLKGRSARLVVTMGMPAFVFRYYFRAHSIKALERNILGFVGIAPIHETFIGMTGEMDKATAQGWLTKLRKLGEKGE